MFAIFGVEEVETALGKLENRLVVLLTRRRGSEIARSKRQLGVDVLKDAIEGSVSIIVRSSNNVDEGTAGWEIDGLHESSGNEHIPLGLLNLHATMDAEPVESEGLLGIDKVGRWDEETMRGSEGGETFIPETDIVVFLQEKLGEVLHK